MTFRGTTLGTGQDAVLVYVEGAGVKPGVEPFVAEFDRVADFAFSATLAGDVLVVSKILPENQPAAGSDDADELIHACVSVADVVEHIDHDGQVEVTGGKREFFERVVVEDTSCAPIHLAHEREFEADIGADQWVRKKEVVETGVVEHQAYIGVRATADFEGV